MYPSLRKLASPDDNPEDLVRELYAELKGLARHRMAMERPGSTLNTTGLVHEAWLRLEKDGPAPWDNKAHFFGAAAEAMRRILVEAARRRLAAKRGGGTTPEALDGLEIPDSTSDAHLIAVHEALDHLEAVDEIKARIVKLRFFSGMENKEIAALLGVNEKTVRRHWELAKVWLYRNLKKS